MNGMYACKHMMVLQQQGRLYISGHGSHMDHDAVHEWLGMNGWTRQMHGRCNNHLLAGRCMLTTQCGWHASLTEQLPVHQQDGTATPCNLAYSSWAAFKVQLECGAQLWYL